MAFPVRETRCRLVASPGTIAAVTSGAGVPVLWICGPAGVGKTTVSWLLYQELARSGVRVAFADSDQLCMCYPAPASDPGRQHIKALNAGALIQNFSSAGAQCVIVNGVLGPAGLETSLLAGARVTICRLRASPGDVEGRFVARSGRPDGTDELLQEIRDEVRLMDGSSFADACVDTTGVPAGDVPGLVRAACQDWPGFSGRLEEPAGRLPDQPGPAAGGRVALVTGPAGVGKSTIGFRFYATCVSAGLTAGYVDLSQIGFTEPAAASDPGNQRLKARNLAAIWRNYRAAGATHLVAAGPIASRADLRLYAGELPGTGIDLIRLRADPDELRQRVMSRGAGGSWPEPGDRLAGQSAGFLAGAAGQAVRAASALDRPDAGGLAVDTTGRSPDESACMIRDALGWP
jgi:adenylylsulfate kinase-like enzyme